MLEATTYNFKDIYNATLLLIEAKNRNKEHVMLELKVGREDKLRQLSSWSHSRIKNMAVSTQFDPKELVLRNSFGAMSPSSQPVLMFSFSAGEKKDIVLSWVDPGLNVVTAHKIHLNETAGIVDVKPSLKYPLR